MTAPCVLSSRQIVVSLLLSFFLSEIRIAVGRFAARPATDLRSQRNLQSTPATANAFINMVDFGGCPAEEEHTNTLRVEFFLADIEVGALFSVEMITSNRSDNMFRTDKFTHKKLHPGHVVLLPFYTDFFNDPDLEFTTSGQIVLSSGASEMGTYVQHDCIKWGDDELWAEFPEALRCSGKPLYGFHESAGERRVWRLVSPRYGFPPFKGEVRSDFIGGDWDNEYQLEIVDPRMCSLGYKNDEQNIVGINRSTTWINEVLHEVSCPGYAGPAGKNDTDTYSGMELVSWGHGSYLVVAVTGDTRGYTWVNFDQCDACWNIKWIEFTDFTDDPVSGALNYTNLWQGSLHVFKPGGFMISQFQWGEHECATVGIPIHYSRYDPDYVADPDYPTEPWLFYPLNKASPMDENYYTLSDEMGVMSDGGWRQTNFKYSEINCSPGDLNAEQTLAQAPPTTIAPTMAPSTAIGVSMSSTVEVSSPSPITTAADSGNTGGAAGTTQGSGGDAMTSTNDDGGEVITTGSDGGTNPAEGTESETQPPAETTDGTTTTTTAALVPGAATRQSLAGGLVTNAVWTGAVLSATIVGLGGLEFSANV